MDPQRKRRMFDLVVAMGFKEIEIGFPSASRADFAFVRELVETNAIPSDVTVAVLTQSRAELIERTFEAIRGVPRAVVHLYNSTSPLQRRVVFKESRAGVKALAVSGAELCLKLAERSGTDVFFEYSPESFSGTELVYAAEVCEAVCEVWQPTPDRRAIINLPATVEMSTPNVYADQIEWMHRNLSRRDALVLSLHPHNDRGTAVAAAELGLMAGADRVEGCLFGNGERTGNVCLVTLGLNLFSQGIDPRLDFSDLDEIRSTVEHCNQLPVHPRHPYGGDLVHTAFSGSHQDAIRKGLNALEAAAAARNTPMAQLPWEVPYLPVDPQDLGRSYRAVIRVNSQSGKGGVAYVMSRHGFELPRRLQIAFSAIIQERTDRIGGEVTPQGMLAAFQREYLDAGDPAPTALSAQRPESDDVPMALLDHLLPPKWDGVAPLAVDLRRGETIHHIQGRGLAPLPALVDALRALGVDLRVLDHTAHRLRTPVPERSGVTVRPGAARRAPTPPEAAPRTVGAPGTTTDPQARPSAPPITAEPATSEPAAGEPPTIGAATVCYAECSVAGRTSWGAAVHPDPVTASFRAVLSAVNRASRRS